MEFGKICVCILRMEMVRYCALNVQGWSYLKSPSSCMVTDSGGSKLLEAAMSEVDFLLGKTLIEAVIVNNGRRLEAGSMHVVFFSGHIRYCVKRFEGKVNWKSDFLLSAMHNMHLNFISINNLCQPDLETMSFMLRMSILFGSHLQRLLLWCSMVQQMLFIKWDLFVFQSDLFYM